MGILTGDFVFVGDVGRPDLLETAAGQVGNMIESASVLFESLQHFKNMAPELMLWPGHGAGSACGKNLGAVPASTVGYELITNKSILKASEEEIFVKHILDGQPEPPVYFARMKDLNRIGPPVLDRLPVPKRIDASYLDQIRIDSNIVFVDTRPWEDFCKGHLPGSLFIPTDSAFSTLIGSYVAPETSICLIAEEWDLDEAIRHSVRVGVDAIDYHLSPSEYRRYSDSGSEVFSLDEVGISELSERLLGPEAFLVDVRRASELAETGKIGKAYNIGHTQMRTRYQELPKDRRLYVYCRTGNRSRYSAAFLAARGYEITHVTGGIEEWIGLNHPVETV
jgi:hydroxyacylglutathione hydrolase